MLVTPAADETRTAGRAAANSAWMALGAFVAVGQGVVVAFVMSRHLGVVAFGELGLIMSCTSVVLFASGSSVANVLRESARARLDGALVGAAIVAQLLLATPVLAAALVALDVATGDPGLLGPAAVLGGALLLRTALGPVIGFHLGRERMVWQMLDTVQSVLMVAALLVLVACGVGLYALPLASLAATGAVVLAAAATVDRATLGVDRATLGVDRATPRVDGAAIRLLLVPTLLWSSATLAQQIHWSVEPLLAPTLMDPTQVGLFVAGNRLFPAVRAVASALGLVFLPGFVRAVARGDAKEVRARAATSLRVLLAAGIGAAVVLFAAASWITRLLFPPEFAATATIVRWLSATPAAIFLHAHALCLLFAADALRSLLAGYGAALVARLALAWVLGGAYGAPGLAAAELASDWILGLTTEIVAYRVLSLRYRNS